MGENAMTCNCGHETSDHIWEGHPFLRHYTSCKLCECKHFEHRKTILERIGFDKDHRAVVCLIFYAIAFVCGLMIQNWFDAGDRRNLAFLEAKYGYVGYELVNEITFCYYAYDQSHGTDNRCPFWINDNNSAVIP
jgi:hypothetical protein